MTTMTIRDLEISVQAGLEALRAITLNNDAESAKELLLPEGLTPVVELVNDNLRKKRSSAAAWNWNPAIDRVIISFRPSAGQNSPSLADASASDVVPAPLIAEPVTSPDKAAAETQHTHALRSPAENPDESNSGESVGNGESAPPVTAQDVIECCQALALAERSNRHFTGLKWFRDELLSTVGYSWAQSPQRRQQVLSQAIAMGRIDLKKIPNPKLPDYPTTGISLNRAVPIPGVTSRFRPIPIRGGPASATLLADRGSF